MTRPPLELLALLALAGAVVGWFLAHGPRVRVALALVAAVTVGTTTALIFLGESMRIALLTGAPDRSGQGAALAGAAVVAAAPAAALLGRLARRSLKAALVGRAEVTPGG